MWRAKTTGEKHAEKRIRRGWQLSAAVLIVLDVAVPFPSSHGRILASLALPIHQWIHGAVPNLIAAGLVLAACYWLFRSPAVQDSALICQKCNRFMENNGRIQCHCGGSLLQEEEMKWTDHTVNPGKLPDPLEPRVLLSVPHGRILMLPPVS
jgi:hypothetical protein